MRLNNLKGGLVMNYTPKAVLGTPEVMDLDGAYFKIRYRLKIRKPKNFGNDVLDRLMYFGFEIISVGMWYVTLLLPSHWWASKVRKGTMFYDYMGRLRVVLNKHREIDFVRRYSVQLLMDPIRVKEYESFMGCVIDYATIANVIPFSKDFKLNAIIDSHGDREKLESIYMRACYAYMDKRFPAWQIETMYWDDPEEELVYDED
jgi:hypothetical protein